MKLKILFFVVAVLLVVSSVANAGEQIWYSTEVFPQDNPVCVQVENTIYCPAGSPPIIVTFTRVRDEELLTRIHSANNPVDEQPSGN